MPPVIRQKRPLLPLFAIALLAGCQTAPSYNPPVASPSVGTLGGAGAGALLGRAVAGRRDNTLAVLGGALLGGVAGNVFVDRPRATNQAVEAEVSRDREVQRRLDYERQSELQRAETQRQIQEQQLFEQWKSERGGVTPASAEVPGRVSGGADVQSAQRLLTGLGYYDGPLDGVLGAGTRSAVMQFEESQGLPRTGSVTPSLVQRMRAALAA